MTAAALPTLCLLALLPLAAAAEKAKDLDPAPIYALATKLIALHVIKPPPKPGEWLATQKEDGQTFAQYVASDPNRPTRMLTTIYVQQLGEFTAEQTRLAADTADFIHRLFGLPVKTADKLGLESLPETARRVHPRWGMKQVLSTAILDQLLEPRIPADAVAVLGLTASDLWPGDNWNFVFGQASGDGRVGVWSVDRLGDPIKEYPLCLKRTLKIAGHETGHMFGIAHCTAYQCLMNGSISLPETDKGPLWLCPECQAKIWWSCRNNPGKRLHDLAEFAGAHQFTDEATLWTKSEQAIAPAP